jgi:hypothetical protein
MFCHSMNKQLQLRAILYWHCQHSAVSRNLPVGASFKNGTTKILIKTILRKLKSQRTQFPIKCTSITLRFGVLDYRFLSFLVNLKG